MEFDPADLYEPETGRQRKVQELPEYLRKGIGLEASLHDGTIVYLPVVNSSSSAVTGRLPCTMYDIGIAETPMESASALCDTCSSSGISFR